MFVRIDDAATAYKCAQCNRKQKALRRSEIVRSPEMLIVAICRFRRSEQGAFVRVDVLSPLIVPVRP